MTPSLLQTVPESFNQPGHQPGDFMSSITEFLTVLKVHLVRCQLCTILSISTFQQRLCSRLFSDKMEFVPEKK